MLRHYLEELFEPTLLYSFALAVLGISLAYYYGFFSLGTALLIIIGSVLAQISVNVISDYFDYQSGLDRELVKKKKGSMSGGSSLLATGKIKPGYTLLAGMVAFAFAAVIGIYFIYVQIAILSILLIAALSILLYARYVKKIPYLSEPLCTFNYTLISLGSFVVMAGVSSLSYAILFSFVPAGIMLGGNALFVNEVPDRKIDRKFGIRHSAVMLKDEKEIGKYYLSLQLAAYALIVIGVALQMLPKLALLTLITIPTTFYVFSGLYNADSKNYGRYLGLHTLSSFILTMLLAFSFVIGI
jgi:1,4-dihydroxy-2-naphthoate polyprenyltransferase